MRQQAGRSEADTKIRTLRSKSKGTLEAQSKKHPREQDSEEGPRKRINKTGNRLKTTDSIYHRLSDDEIRILVLLPGNLRLIKCQLEVASLSSNVYYDALSYVWGPTSGSATIVCNGVAITITDNLHAAFLRLRSTSKPRRLWVDALCIHQDDVTERTQQVRLMKSIYQNARMVRIWLGECERFEEIPREFSWRDTPFPTRQRIALTYRTLYDRSWFFRKWTLQEIVLARKAVVHCGIFKIPWTDLEEACNSDYSRYYDDRTDRIEAIRNIRKAFEKKERIRLSNLLLATRFRKSTDDRDMVYAVMGLLSTTRNSLHPDYSL